MEGKELVSKLLTEHKTFLNKVTSLQLEGISQTDMDSYKSSRQNTLK